MRAIKTRLATQNDIDCSCNVYGCRWPTHVAVEIVSIFTLRFCRLHAKSLRDQLRDALGPSGKVRP